MTTTKLLECSCNSYMFVPNYHPSRCMLSNTHYCNKFLSLQVNKQEKLTSLKISSIWKRKVSMHRGHSPLSPTTRIKSNDFKNQHFSLIMVTGFLKNNSICEKLGMWHLGFLQSCCCRFKSSGLLCHADLQIITDVSKNCSAFIFRVKQSKMNSSPSQDKGTNTIL
jgi:hypothetical protein